MPVEDHERQSLLSKDKNDKFKQYPSLPWSQVAILGIWRATHAIYFGYIFTWITPFILSNDLADIKTVGTVAGWIESAYSIGVLAGLAPASYISDRVGRKSTAITGVVLASIGTVAFGFVKSLVGLIASRFYIGFFVAFIPATVVTTLIELSNPRTLPQVFAISSVAWTTGSVIAPGLGGFLAEPARLYPHVFEGTIFEKYPYALAGIVAACLPLISVLLGLYFVEETLPIERKRSFLDMFRGGNNEQGNSSGSKACLETPISGLFTKPVVFILVLWGWFVFLALAHLVAEVLFLSSSESVGGLNLSPRSIGILYSIRPLLINIFNVLTYPALASRYSTESIFRWGITCITTTYYAGYFILGYSATFLHPTHTTIMVVLLGLGVLNALNGNCGPAAQQTLSSRAPNRAYLNKLNTASEYTSNIGHGLGAIAGSNLWALGVRYKLVRSQMVWLVLLALATLLATLCGRLTKMKSWMEEEEEQQEIQAEGNASSTGPVDRYGSMDD